MNPWLSNRSALLLTAILAAVSGCAGLGTRVPPPASSFETLTNPGFQPPQIEVPGATAIPTGSNSGIAATAHPAPVPANNVTVSAPSSPQPRQPLKAPESGWSTVDPSRDSKPQATLRKPPEPQPELTIRGQSPGAAWPTYGQPATGQPVTGQPPAGYPQGYPQGPVAQPQYQPQPPTTYGQANPGFSYTPANGGQNLPAPSATIGLPQQGAAAAPFGNQPWPPPSVTNPNPEYVMQATPTPLDVFVEETRTGRFMFGVGVNSDAGVTGQITVDERNFDITRPPVSFDDFLNGTAWRGAGQGFRLEAQPGSRVQRYLVSFTEPYLFNTSISMNTSGFYFDRGYLDWTESRLGGRLGFGYRLTPDLSVTAAIRAEDVNIHNPRILGIPQLDNSLGHTDLYGAKLALTHDTRDLPFMPTEGHMINVSYEQVFGEFNFPRFEADYAQYFMLRERPDGSGRHTLAFTLKYGMMGPDAPIFEHYFAGGFSSLRGFSFRGAGPIDTTVRVGGRSQLIGSLEYFLPLTADDMIKGVAFCDFGTVEEDLKIRGDNFRVAPGFGLRVNVPALGPAPLAFDFAFPVAYQNTDDRQVFSFYVGFARQ